MHLQFERHLRLEFQGAKIRDAKEIIEMAGAQRLYKYTPQDHSGLVPPVGTLVVEDGRATFVEWIDVTQYVYFPEGIEVRDG